MTTTNRPTTRPSDRTSGQRPAARRRARAERHRRGSGPDRGRLPYRRLRIVDAENLVGQGHFTMAQLGEARMALEETFPAGPWDQTLVGVDKGNVLDAKLTWPGAQVVWGVGPDGADQALIESSDPYWIAAHFDEVVIASGDHAFGPLAAALRDLGVRVTVVSRPGQISADLYIAAADYRTVRYIDLTGLDGEAR